MREAFEERNLEKSTLVLIGAAAKVLEEYAEQGFVLTVRQLFYQFVSRGWIENTQRAYGRVVNAVGKGRLCGYLDWELIEDRARETVYGAHWNDPAEIVDAAAQWFRIDKWEDQPNHVEVMIEKDALAGVLEPVCQELDLRFTANRGYGSLSLMYRVGKRLDRMAQDGKTVHVLYLGDHDPSGLDMDRDIGDRLSMFSGVSLDPRRLALTMEQVEEYDPPENPAKLTDSRAQGYILSYGYSSWELDALEPSVLAALVRSAVADLRDDDLWRAAVERESQMRQELQEFADEYRGGAGPE